MLNNVVVLAVLAVYVLVPGEITLDPARLGEPKLLVLGLGTTLGIVVQAARADPGAAPDRASATARCGAGTRGCTQAGGLAVWVVAYVLIGQAGYIVTTRVAAARPPARVAIYANAWLLLQVPYGVLGVSLLTALMPRMSRAAAEGRTADVVADLSLGSRLPAVLLVPVSVLLTCSARRSASRCSASASANLDGAAQLGAALAVSAFGLLPFGDHDAAAAGVLRDHRQPHPDADPAGHGRGEDPAAAAVPRALLPAPGRGARAGRGQQRRRSWPARCSARCCCAGGSAGCRPDSVLAAVLADAAAAAVLRRAAGLRRGARCRRRRSPGWRRWPAPGSCWCIAVLVIGGPAVGARHGLLRVREMNPFVARLERLVDRRKPRRGAPR